MKPPVWHWKEYLLARQQFVDAREFRVSTTGLGLVFTATWLVGWAASTALLRWAHMTAMAPRYALATLVGYAAFFAAVRAWADFQRDLPHGRPDDGVGALELMQAPGDEGCLLVVAVLLLSLLAAWLVSVFGGAAALLEVAFEVAFAGTVVRRGLAPGLVVGRWWQALLRRTLLPAALVATLVIALAAAIQARYPQASTLGEAAQLWVASRHLR